LVEAPVDVAEDVPDPVVSLGVEVSLEDEAAEDEQDAIPATAAKANKTNPNFTNTFFFFISFTFFISIYKHINFSIN
jgi:hypothetical protein